MQTEKQKNSWLREAFANEESNAYRWVNNFIVLLILASIILVVISSVEEIYARYTKLIDILEWIIVGIFTVEYAINIYVAKKKIKYIFSIWGIIDFLAIAPSYLGVLTIIPFINLTPLKILRSVRVLRFLRLMRMMRLLKLAKKAAGEYDERESKMDTLKMDLQIYFIALFSCVTIFSTLMYYAERNVPETFFKSIPGAMWWCITTMTTVGYGDMYPKAVIGKLIASVTMLCGVALFGLLMNVIGKSMMSSLFGAEDLETVKVSEKKEEE